MNIPIVLVVSSCSQTPALDIIAKIRKIPSDDKTEKLEDGEILYIHEIKTKYYSTQIAFLPIENTSNLAECLKESVEGVLVYFNSKNRSVLETLPQHVEFIKSNQIEFCMMLCKELQDDAATGVTFKCIKDCYNMLDIIELEKASDDAEDEDDDGGDPFNPCGYEELAQALRSVIWSNVDVNHVSNGKSQISNGLQHNEVDSSNEELNVEAELENFEKLLNQMMQFRPATSNMSRDDRLNCAQGFAEIFEKLIMQDEDVNSLQKD